MFLIDKKSVYPSILISSLIKIINIKILILEKNLVINKNKLETQLNNNIKKYEKFIRENLVSKNNEFSHMQIKNIIFKKEK